MPNRNNPLELVPPVHRATHRIGLFIQSLGLGVTQGEAHVLAHLASGPCSIAVLQRAFAHRPSTLTSILDRLEARGVVARKVRREDRRSFEVTLTARGQSRARAVHQALADLEAAVGRSVTVAQRRGFEAVTAALEASARGRSGRKR